MPTFPFRGHRPQLYRRRPTVLRAEGLENRRALSVAPATVGILIDDAAFARAAASVDATALEAAQATRWVVRMSPGADATAAALAAGATTVKPTGIIADTFILEFPANTTGSIPGTLAAATASRSHGLVAAYPLVPRQQQPRLTPNDPLFFNQWHLLNTGQGGGTAGEDVNVTDVWDLYQGTGVTIAIVDDGLQRTHPDLVSNYVASASYDFNDDDPDPTPVGSDAHGTAAGGVAAATGNNGLGGAGAAPGASLAGLRLIAGPADDLMEATALTYALADVDIYSNSWGPTDSGTQLTGPGPLTLAALQQGITEGRGGLGAIYVWAAGNGLENNDNVNYDAYANSRFTIAVTAIDNLGGQPFYAEPGAAILVAAPSNGGSRGITTTDLVGAAGYNAATSGAGGDYTNTFGGTSSATPLVSGIVALMLEANPGLGWRDVQHVLVNSARRNDPTDADWIRNGDGRWVNHKYGFGTVDAAAAVALAETWTNVGAEVRASSGTQAVNLAIPDNNAAGVSTSFMMPTSLVTEWVEVTFSATHPYRGDLEVVLTSPAGTESVLAETRDDSGDNYTTWKFTSARTWGESSAGTWTLTVRDLGAADLGTLDSWSLDVYGTTAVDTVAPSVAIATTNPGPLLIGNSAPITFTLSEPVSGFTSGSITTTGGTLSAFSGSGTTYSAIFTPAAGYVGTATVSVGAGAFTDAAGNGNTPSNTLTIAVDTVAPTLTISRVGSGVVTIGQTVTILFSLSATATNFTAADVLTTGGVLTGFVGFGSSYAATFTPAAGFQGTATISVPAGGFTGPSGNGNQAAAMQLSVDTAAPTIVIARTGGPILRVGDSVTLTFTLSEPVTNFAAADVSVSGGVLSGFTGSGSIYTATFAPIPEAESTATLTVPGGAFTDAAGNASTASATMAIAFDTSPPRLVISRVGTTTVIGGSTTLISFALTEASTTFGLQDVLTVGGTISNLTGSNAAYQAIFTPAAGFTGSASIVVPGGVFSDAAGNLNLVATPLSIPVDTVTPTLSISRSGGTIRTGDTATISFIFSEPPASFTAADVGVSGGSITGLTGSGAAYTATFTPNDGLEGSAVITVAAGSFIDLAGNPNVVGSSIFLDVDTVRPQLTVTADAVLPLTIGATATIRFVLSEPSLTFGLADVSVTGGTLSGFTGSGAAYSASFTPSPNLEGLATVFVNAGALADVAGNPTAEDSRILVSVDTIAPSITVSRVGTLPLITGDAAVLSLTLSEASPNFGLGSIVVEGGSLSDLTGGGTTYSVRLTPTAETRGLARVLVPALQFQDLAGNGNVGSGELAIPVDTVAPKIAGFTSPTTEAAIEIGGTVAIVAEFSEAVLPGQSLSARLSSGGVVQLVIAPDGLTAGGLYTVQPGEVSRILDVVEIALNGSVRNAVGNYLTTVLPSPAYSLAVRRPIFVDGAVKFRSSGRFSVDPSRIPDALDQFRRVPIRFTTPVNGFTLEAFTITLNGWTMPLTRARLQGSGDAYVLTLPATRWNPVGIYRLSLTPSHNVRATANNAVASRDFAIHWGFGRSVGMVPDAPPAVAPIEVLRTGRRISVTLAWQPPAANGGGPITHYVVHYRIVGTQRWLPVRTFVPGGTNRVSIGSLTPGQTYEFRAAAANAAGIGGFGVSTPFRVG